MTFSEYAYPDATELLTQVLWRRRAVRSGLDSPDGRDTFRS